MATAVYTTEVLDQIDRGEHAPSRQLIERQYFTFPVDVAIGTGDILYLMSIPEGMRLAGGLFKNTAGGETVTGQIGEYTYEKVMEGEPLTWTGAYIWTVGTVTKFGSLTTLAGATSQTFGDTGGKSVGYPGTKTNNTLPRIGILFTDNGGGEVVQATAVISGHVDFVKGSAL